MKNFQALAKFLECKVSFLKTTYDNNIFEYKDQEYLVLTEDEANEKAKEYIIDTLWAFNANFILKFAGIYTHDVEKAFEKMQEQLCESCNDLIFAIIGKDNIDRFIKKAIEADGRGRFLSSYNGKEHQKGEYFIYRVN